MVVAYLHLGIHFREQRLDCEEWRLGAYLVFLFSSSFIVTY